MIDAPRFPPLLRGVAAGSDMEPMDKACGLAMRGCQGGTVVHALRSDRLGAALVFAPEVCLGEAMAMFPVCGLGLQNAMGALAPPEVAVQLTWDGQIHINGARCGALSVGASSRDPGSVPDWLVVGVDVRLAQSGADPGATPEVTALYDEGCADVSATHLLEAWARHTMVWINRWADAGNICLLDHWTGLLLGVGAPVQRGVMQGQFLGVNENFGMRIQSGGITHLVPLTSLLEEQR